MIEDDPLSKGSLDTAAKMSSRRISDYFHKRELADYNKPLLRQRTMPERQSRVTNRINPADIVESIKKNIRHKSDSRGRSQAGRSHEDQIKDSPVQWRHHSSSTPRMKLQKFGSGQLSSMARPSTSDNLDAKVEALRAEAARISSVAAAKCGVGGSREKPSGPSFASRSLEGTSLSRGGEGGGEASRFAQPKKSIGHRRTSSIGEPSQPSQSVVIHKSLPSRSRWADHANGSQILHSTADEGELFLEGDHQSSKQATMKIRYPMQYQSSYMQSVAGSKDEAHHHLRLLSNEFINNQSKFSNQDGRTLSFNNTQEVDMNQILIQASKEKLHDRKFIDSVPTENTITRIFSHKDENDDPLHRTQALQSNWNQGIMMGGVASSQKSSQAFDQTQKVQSIINSLSDRKRHVLSGANILSGGPTSPQGAILSGRTAELPFHERQAEDRVVDQILNFIKTKIEQSKIKEEMDTLSYALNLKRQQERGLGKPAQSVGTLGEDRCRPSTQLNKTLSADLSNVNAGGLQGSAAVNQTFSPVEQLVDLASFKAQVKELAHIIERKNQRITSLEKQHALLQEDIAFFQRRNECLDQNVKRKEKLILDKDAKLQEYRDLVKAKQQDSLENESKVKSLEEQLESLKQENLEIKNKVYDGERTIRYLEERLQDCQQQDSRQTPLDHYQKRAKTQQHGARWRESGRNSAALDVKDDYFHTSQVTPKNWGVSRVSDFANRKRPMDSEAHNSRIFESNLKDGYKTKAMQRNGSSTNNLDFWRQVRRGNSIQYASNISRGSIHNSANTPMNITDLTLPLDRLEAVIVDQFVGAFRPKDGAHVAEIIKKCQKEKKFVAKVQKLISDVEGKNSVSVADTWKWVKGLLHDFMQLQVVSEKAEKQLIKLSKEREQLIAEKLTFQSLTLSSFSQLQKMLQTNQTTSGTGLHQSQNISSTQNIAPELLSSSMGMNSNVRQNAMHSTAVNNCWPQQSLDSFGYDSFNQLANPNRVPVIVSPPSQPPQAHLQAQHLGHDHYQGQLQDQLVPPPGLLQKPSSPTAAQTNILTQPQQITVGSPSQHLQRGHVQVVQAPQMAEDDDFNLVNLPLKKRRPSKHNRKGSKRSAKGEAKSIRSSSAAYRDPLAIKKSHSKSRQVGSGFQANTAQTMKHGPSSALHNDGGHFALNNSVAMFSSDFQAMPKTTSPFGAVDGAQPTVADIPPSQVGSRHYIMNIDEPLAANDNPTGREGQFHPHDYHRITQNSSSNNTTHQNSNQTIPPLNKRPGATRSSIPTPQPYTDSSPYGSAYQGAGPQGNSSQIPMKQGSACEFGSVGPVSQYHHSANTCKQESVPTDAGLPSHLEFSASHRPQIEQYFQSSSAGAGYPSTSDPSRGAGPATASSQQQLVHQSISSIHPSSGMVMPSYQGSSIQRQQHPAHIQPPSLQLPHGEEQVPRTADVLSEPNIQFNMPSQGQPMGGGPGAASDFQVEEEFKTNSLQEQMNVEAFPLQNQHGQHLHPDLISSSPPLTMMNRRQTNGVNRLMTAAQNGELNVHQFLNQHSRVEH